MVNLISNWLENYWEIPLTAIRLRILMSILIPVCIFLSGVQIVLVLGIMTISWLVTLGTLAGFIYPAIPATLSLIFLGVPLLKLRKLILTKTPKLLAGEALFYFWILAGFFLLVHIGEFGFIALVNQGH